MTDLPEHVRRNRAQWDSWADWYATPGREQWAAAQPSWGIWRVPESQLRMLPADLHGRDAIELGCGTAYVSAWLARRGARPVAIDNSQSQLDTARRLQQEFAIEFALLHGNAEEVPYPDASFDFAMRRRVGRVPSPARRAHRAAARAAWRSRSSSRSVRPTAPRAGTRTSPSRGLSGGRARRSGRSASAADRPPATLRAPS